MSSCVVYVVALTVVVSVSSLPQSLFLEQWSLSSEQPHGPRCVPIPANLTLCQDMQYDQMRLPNILEHDTMDEAIASSRDFKSLVQLNCHPDAKLFLCSLFAPICLPTVDREIPPCRSLCQAVKQGCESRIKFYHFSWPAMLDCDKFPEDNDMCVRPVEKQGAASSLPNGPTDESSQISARDISCPACSQVATYENLVDHFCRSSHVFKARIGQVTSTHVKILGGRSLKKSDRRKSISPMEIRLSADRSECPCALTSAERYMVMASKINDQLTANLIVPFRKEPSIKKAIHQFQKLNCKSIGREIRESASRRPHYYQMRKHNTGRYSLI